MCVEERAQTYQVWKIGKQRNRQSRHLFKGEHKLELANLMPSCYKTRLHSKKFFVQALTNLLSISAALPILDILYKWNHATCVLVSAHQGFKVIRVIVLHSLVFLIPLVNMEHYLESLLLMTIENVCIGF